ncbi:glycoside hydrolase family 32 protein [Lentzea sp. NBC_00516]|uniref:glycoside hydrolase family 32 protein n=1 Tax=Lentzea sp. NBC_00516 TaxID=2903582 RepID=UPI002E8019F7|nr:glycoside hydrolase family 32 protein [Lentzea sp. NBC_00516]WUD26735.1 glycoside hydrolase family 32 protein [Lentzea sp. NBC_00516]
MRALLVVLATAFALLVPAGPTSAGTAPDYAEFPYAPTTYAEPFRGQFHFSSQSGWMNDPNGLVFANGLYHFFYQHNPHGLEWDTMHWGHATSPDLVHWTQKPIALEPGVHPGTLFSGGGIVDKFNTSGLKTGALDPIVVFSNTNGVSVFYSNDNGRSFQAYDGGRKQIEIPEESRDPNVVWDADRRQWVMVVWSNRGGNGADIYTSPNLLQWTFASRYAADWLFECPDLFVLPLDGRPQWVLTSATSEYVVGTFDGKTFRTDRPQPKKMNLGTTYPGGTFYAAESFDNTPDGRVVQMAWQGGNRGGSWTGNATFPVALGLVGSPDGPKITRTPVAELDSLRADTRTWRNTTVTATNNPFSGILADTYEITARFDLRGATAQEFGFALHSRSDGTADRTVTYDRAAGTLYDRPFQVTGDEVSVRLLVDRGQLEVFSGDGLFSVADNVNFDSAAVSQGIRLFANGGQVRLKDAKFTRLSTSWGTAQSTLESNLSGPWHATAGSWTDVAGGKRAEAAGDSFYLSASTAGDATYQGDLRLDTAQAAGLTFRATPEGAGYTANIDAAGVVKLWRPGRDIASYATPIAQGQTYHLRVQTTGSRIQVWLNHGTSPIIDATDTAYASGRFGANVYRGAATVQNLNTGPSGFAAFASGPWTAVGGTWTATPDSLRASASGDAFYLSDRTAADLVYEGDLSIVNGVAVGLTFRAGADGAGYTANIDSSGAVKLWRPGRDIATYSTPIVQGRAYHLKVQATGSRIQVWLDRGTSPVIDATDATYGAGRVGLNVYAGTASVRQLAIS